MKRICPRIRNLEFDVPTNQCGFNATFPISNGVCPEIGENTLLGQTIKEVSLITQAAGAIIISTALSAIATALQKHINVELPTGKVCPVSLYLLTCADSGERKSTVESEFNKGIKSYQIKHQQSYLEQLRKYEIFLGFHEAKSKSLKNKLKLAAAEEPSDLLQVLIEHDGRKPERPKAPKMIYEDSSIEALMFGLKTDSPYAYLGSSEGGVLINSALMSKTPVFNAFWSGDDVNVARKTTDSYTLSDVRLTTHIMIQPATLKRFMEKSQDVVRDNGYLSRFLVCFPSPVSGYRTINGIRYEKEFTTKFNRRIEEFLERKVNESLIFIFCDEAKDLWINIYNDIERKMQPAGIYENAKDHASKLAENIARVAALIHYFEYSFDSKISVESLNVAVQLVSYYSFYFLTYFCPPPLDEVLAKNLESWFHSLKGNGFRYVKKNKILQYGPKCIRKSQYLNDALNNLCSKDLIAIHDYKNTVVVDLSPLLAYDQMSFVRDIGLGFNRSSLF